jgi:hypothetical protein
MKRRTTSVLRSAAIVGVICSAFSASGAYAQDQQDEENGKPKPAAHAPLIDQNAADTTTDPNALTPDTSPLTGIQTPGLGSVEFRHSYWVPGVQVANTVQSGGNGGNWFDVTYLAGNLSLSEAWPHAHLGLNYSGGGYFSTDNEGNGTYQQLGFLQSFDWRRLQLQFFDELAYLPTSQFGFGGLSGIGTPGIGGSLSPVAPLVGGAFLPNQTILLANGPRYSNSFAVQADFKITPRSSITLIGSYGLLRFTNPGNIDNDDVIGSIGYNYQVTKKDTLGVLYRFTAYHFTGVSQAIGDHVFNVAYGRRITGRLGLGLFAGPEIVTFRIPIGGKTQQTNLSVGASLSYGFEWGVVTLSYNHGTNGGSGILAGAIGDNVIANANRKITRVWSARANVGYGREHAFAAVVVPGTPTIGVPSYDSYYLGAGLDRPIGRNGLLSFGYTAYITSTNLAACGISVCTGGGTSTQHQLAVGYQWHTRPFVLR